MLLAKIMDTRQVERQSTMENLVGIRREKQQMCFQLIQMDN